MAPSLIALPLAVWERDGLAAALRKAGLPADDITERRALFWRFSTEDNVPAGFGGLEIYGPDALMRSVVTLSPRRGRGIGAAIVCALEAEAQLLKCDSLYALTTTARRLFEKLGYLALDRAHAPATIRATTQLSSLCADRATLMRNGLVDHEGTHRATLTVPV